MPNRAPPDHVSYFAQARPDKLACADLDRGRRLSYRELDARVWRVSAMLEQLLDGRTEGARVASLARNSTDLLCLYVACIRTGAIYAPLNWRLSSVELAALAPTIEPSLLFFDPEFEGAASAIAAASPLVEAIDTRDGFQRALSRAEERPRRSVTRRADAVTTLLCT